jgi:hypothetical protein
MGKERIGIMWRRTLSEGHVQLCFTENPSPYSTSTPFVFASLGSAYFSVVNPLEIDIAPDSTLTGFITAGLGPPVQGALISYTPSNLRPVAAAFIGYDADESEFTFFVLLQGESPPAFSTVVLSKSGSTPITLDVTDATSGSSPGYFSVEWNQLFVASPPWSDGDIITMTFS